MNTQPQELPFKIGQLLIVTDYKGDQFPCHYAGQDRKKALITINGHTTATEVQNLRKRFK